MDSGATANAACAHSRSGRKRTWFIVFIMVPRLGRKSGRPGHSRRNLLISSKQQIRRVKYLNCCHPFLFLNIFRRADISRSQSCGEALRRGLRAAEKVQFHLECRCCWPSKREQAINRIDVWIALSVARAACPVHLLQSCQAALMSGQKSPLGTQRAVVCEIRHFNIKWKDLRVARRANGLTADISHQ